MSEKLKPTEGPWNYLEDGDANFYHVTDKENKWLLCLKHNGEQPTLRQKANLKLIATSPELLECLKQGEDIISGLEAQADNAGIDIIEVRAWWQEAGRLIQKAGGETT